MTDLPAASAQITNAGEPAPEGTGQQAAPDATNTTAQLFTQEQINFLTQFIPEHSRPVAQDVANKTFRGMQSAQKTFENRVTAEVKKLTEKFGIPNTPELRDKVREDLAEQLENESPDLGGQPNQTGAQPEADNPIVAAAKEFVQEHGINLAEGDIELASVDDSTPARFLKTFEAALVAKKARLEKQSAINNPRNIPSAGQRVGVTNPIAAITDMDQLYKLANKK